MQNPREPIFNLQATIVAIAVFLTAIHIARTFLSQESDLWLLFTFGFVPARYDPLFVYYEQMPGGAGSDVWSFVSYALLHGSWIHLGVNIAWMVAFGTPVLRRFGTLRFLALSLVAAVAAAALHLATHWGEFIPMIGASGAISGQMGAAVRFAFQRHVLFGNPNDDDSRWKQPALPLGAAFRDVRVLAFVVIWFAVNIVFGTTSMIPGEEAPVAWQAHIGGFLVGLLLFRFFDPTPTPTPSRNLPGEEPEDQNNGSS